MVIKAGVLILNTAMFTQVEIHRALTLYCMKDYIYIKKKKFLSVCITWINLLVGKLLQQSAMVESIV